MNGIEEINPLSLPSLPLADKKQLPNCAAIYFVLENSEVIYIGQASSLVLRWLNHHKFKALKARGSEIKIAWLECSEQALLPSIEFALIKWFKPELNKRHHVSRNHVALSKKVYGVRLPIDLEPIILKLAGDDISTWLRQAAIEKADRDTSKLA